MKKSDDKMTKPTAQSRADEPEERLIDFAVRIIHLSAALPKTPAGRHVAGQILRSGTSSAPNYGEARGAESKSDFVHKLRIVLKEPERDVDLVKDHRSQQASSARTPGRNNSGKQRTLQDLQYITEDGSYPK